MGAVITVIIVLLVIVGVVAAIAVSGYNGFVKSRNQIQESWRQIDVELNRRYELLPNLVETVRGYAAHERNTLEDITRLRGQAQQISQGDGALPSPQRAEVEEALSGAVRNLIVSVEAYPDLKSNSNFLELQRQLTETEDRIAAGRRFYNANVRAYNTKVESVPTNLIARAFSFEKATYFEVNEPAARQAPSVSFGEISYRGDPSAPSAPPAQSTPYAPPPGSDSSYAPPTGPPSDPPRYGPPPGRTGPTPGWPPQPPSPTPGPQEPGQPGSYQPPDQR